MKTKIAIANVIMLGIAVSAQAGYKDMKEAYESYRPSAYFESQLLPAAGRRSLKTQDLFHDDVKKLNATRSNWEKLLKEIKTNRRFSGIDPDLMLSLAAAESDIPAAVDALGGAFSKDILEALVILRNPAITSAENKFRAAIEKNQPGCRSRSNSASIQCLYRRCYDRDWPHERKRPREHEVPLSGCVGFKKPGCSERNRSGQAGYGESRT